MDFMHALPSYLLIPHHQGCLRPKRSCNIILSHGKIVPPPPPRGPRFATTSTTSIECCNGDHLPSTS